MKLFSNRLYVFVACICTVTLSSCTDFGTKVTFPDTKGEVYYKGDGVTEADATAVGKFLKDEQFFSNDKTKSVQITKDSGRIKARFVVDEKAVDTIPGVDASFELIAAAMSKNVFNNTPVDVIYTDNYFKDIKTIPFTPSALTEVNNLDAIQQMQKKTYNKNTLYYSKDIAEAEADTISNYLVSSGFFLPDATNDVIASKEDSSFLLKFIIKASFANADGLQKLDDYGKEIKKNVFANDPFKFEVMDEKMDSIKTFSY